MSELIGTTSARTAQELIDAYRSCRDVICRRIEVRLDGVADAGARIGEIVAAARGDGRTVLATCRGRADDPARLDLLRRAVGAGAGWADVEHDAPDAWLGALRSDGAKILRSAHVPLLPADLASFVASLRAGADGVKVVGLRGGAADAVRLLAEIRKGGVSGHLSPSWFSRAASAALGAEIVFAALRPGLGLMATLPTLTWFHFARVTRLALRPPLFVLIGAGVDRSVSPAMLNMAFEEAGSPIVSVRWECDDPSAALDAILEFGWAGAAVTIPWKERVADEILRRGGRLDRTAERAGAVNTVIREGATLVGHNTDIGGLTDALSRATDVAAMRGRSMLVVGGGGAARAAAVVAQDLDMRALVVARTPARAGAWAPALRASVRTAEAAAAEGPAIVVNATPAGAPGGAAAFDVSRLPSPALVFDMLVSARPTALIRDARAAGHETVEGIHMLLFQAVRQARLLGVESPIELHMLGKGVEMLSVRDGNIVLVGLRGAGKTSIAKGVGAHLGRTVADTDDLVRERLGSTPSELIASGRTGEFRDAERQVLAELAERAGLVVSTGGGAALHREELEALAKSHLVVLLDAPDDVLADRIAGTDRPSLTGLPPLEEIARLRAERMPFYESVAAMRFDTSAHGAAESASAALAAELDAMLFTRLVPAGADLPAREARNP